MKINLPVTGRNVDFAPDANILSTTDLKGAITYANKDFIDISGYGREELLGSPHNLLRHPDMPPEAFEHLWATLKGGNSWMGMVKNRCKNGDHYWVSAYVTPVTRNGQAVEYQSIRTKPSAHQIERAERAYTRMRNPRSSLRQLTPVLGLKTQLWLMLAALMTLVLGAGTWLAAFSPWLALLALGAGLALGGVGMHLLLRPLDRITQRARRIGDNPLSQRIYAGRSDELGQIEFAFQMLEAQVGAVVGRIGDASQRLAGHAAELVEHLQSSHTSTLAQQAETDQVAAAIHEMAASVAQVAGHAQRASQAADQAGSETLEGHHLVGESRSAVLLLATELANATEVIHQLESHSTEISGVLEVIRSIAEQTNLLALNAAIEAARAGDHGRGFAVVASEVRVLAQKTQESTGNIRQMISNLQSGSDRASSSMQETLGKAQDGARKVERAGELLLEIAEGVASISDRNLQIASAAEEQSAVSEDINRNVNEINDLVIQVSAGAEQTAITSQELARLAEHQQRLVNRFKVA